MATIHDVARDAGVSTATVSRVLSAPELVADATRARVTASVERLGYQPNFAAKSLRTLKTEKILVTVPENASPEVVAERRERALAALRRVRGGEPFLPSCRVTLHDSAHKARRILSRPWAADELMDTIVQLFASHRDSPSQLVHHSHDL